MQSLKKPTLLSKERRWKQALISDGYAQYCHIWSSSLNHMQSLWKQFKAMLSRIQNPKNQHMNKRWYLLRDLTNTVQLLQIWSEMGKVEKLILLRVKCSVRYGSLPYYTSSVCHFWVGFHFPFWQNRVQGQLIGKRIKIHLFCYCSSHVQPYIALQRAMIPSSIVEFNGM